MSSRASKSSKPKSSKPKSSKPKSSKPAGGAIPPALLEVVRQLGAFARRHNASAAELGDACDAVTGGAPTI